MKYESAIDHLLDELRRLDLVLLSHLSRVDLRDGEMQESRDTIVSLLGMPADSTAPAGWPPGKSIERALQRHGEMITRTVEESLAQGMRLPLLDLCQNLGLDGDDLAITMLASAPHLDTKYGHVFAYLQGDPRATLPRVDLALNIFSRTARNRLEMRRSLDPNSRLLRTGHVRLQPEDPTLARNLLLEQSIQATPRLIRHLLGDTTPAPLVEAMQPIPPLVAPSISQKQALLRFARLCKDAPAPGPVAMLDCEDPEGVISGVQALAVDLGQGSLCVDLARGLAHSSQLSLRIQEAFREATLCSALLCIVGHPNLTDPEKEHASRAIAAALEEFAGPCIIVGDFARSLSAQVKMRPVVELKAPPPPADERGALWQQALENTAHQSNVDAQALAWRYSLSASEIRDAMSLASADTSSREGSSSIEFPPALVRACRKKARRDLESLAQVIPSRSKWSDLILPERSQEQLAEFVSHLRHHDLVFRRWGLGSKVQVGDGAAALFSGPPGTGKTMASSIVADELGRELFRIDLAGVVSKYIGETEKNLERVFSAAHRSNAVLFFDEADALFGKRTTVRDAHDRYANIETSYLLQKIESFDGVVVLATNFRNNVDEAFLRRMAVIVDFPMPAQEERRRLWALLMPDAMPRGPDIDVDFLAKRFEIAGGHIKNAIQTAAIIAAERPEQIVSFPDLLHGVRREMQKLGKVVDLSDFGQYGHHLQGDRTL